MAIALDVLTPCCCGLSFLRACKLTRGTAALYLQKAGINTPLQTAATLLKLVKIALKYFQLWVGKIWVGKIWGVTPVWRSDVRAGEKEGPQDKKSLPTDRPPNVIVRLPPLEMGDMP